jgi:hypothetical protein
MIALIYTGSSGHPRCFTIDFLETIEVLQTKLALIQGIQDEGPARNSRSSELKMNPGSTVGHYHLNTVNRLGIKARKD